MAQLALLTAGVLHGEGDDPRVKGFFDRIEANFQTAELSVGFIARDDDNPQRGWGETVMPQVLERPEFVGRRALTLSVWADLESVFAYAYNGSHGESLRHRHEWFIKGEWPAYVAWWVADGHIPSWQEAASRLDRLHASGPTDQAFDFKHPFDPHGNPTFIDRDAVRTNASLLPDIHWQETSQLE
jgi:hypothetical protein